ncbi:helix-turn-helix domain-containing protein [Leifsonia sp. AG29]|uniref:helix-turn-helix domain-containing protein n=1 Tax=Leifsonia sp. AG29 TaxID=2598860 RepID=UPI00131D35A4|nr:helix-turn-helix domain-containing protein [Leifsonia sp. AG29]
MLSSVSASGSFGLSCWSGDPAAMGLPHIHDDIEINLSSGALEYLIGGERVAVPAGSLLLFWAAQPHQLIEAEAGRRMHWVTIPLRMLLEWRLPPAFQGRLFAGEVFLLDAEALGVDERRLEQWEAELAGDAFERETARLDLRVQVRRVAAGAARASGAVASEPERRIELVTRMADYVTTHALEQVSVAEVARSVSLHPTYAMTLFKRVLGVTIGDYATTCRIQEAQRRLITTADSVAAIAHDVGYSSLSQFHAKFRSIVGVSPGAYRRGRTGE